MAEQRKQLRVKAGFQDRVIFDVILVTFVLVNLLIVFSVFAVEAVQDLGTLKMTLAVGLAIGELGGLAVIYHLGLQASHKVAGPVFALDRRLDGIANGDLETRLQFRQGDHFKETADRMNSAVDALRGKIASIRHCAESLKDELGESETLSRLIAEIDFFNLAEEDSLGQEGQGHRRGVANSLSELQGPEMQESQQPQPAPVGPKA